MSATLAPGPRGLPIVGALPSMRKDPLGGFTAVWREHGDVVRLPIGAGLSGHIVIHPDDVQRVLRTNAGNYYKHDRFNRRLSLLLGKGILTSDGDVWVAQRKMMQPIFHHSRITGMTELMVSTIEEWLDGWQEHARSGQPVDMAAEMMALTLRLAAGIIFGADLREERLHAFHEKSNEAQSHIGQLMFKLLNVWEYAPFPSTRRFQRARQVLDEIAFALIEERRRTGERGNDLLSMLLDARDEDGNELSDVELRDQVFTNLFAAHETTAQALAWALYLIDRHPDVRERVVGESASVLGGRRPVADDVKALTYTGAVFDETMRLYPPVWAMPRFAREDDQLGGYRVVAGSAVVISPYLTHRHPEFWSGDVEAFDPSRFEPGAMRVRHRYAYFPFGGGPRRCLGEAMARMEGQFVLAMIAQRYALELQRGFEVVREPVLTLRPRDGIPMTVRAAAA